jgi:hypothetical protein
VAAEVAKLREEVQQLRSRVAAPEPQVGRWQLQQPSGGGYVVLFDTATGRLFQPGRNDRGETVWVELQKPPSAGKRLTLKELEQLESAP